MLGKKQLQRYGLGIKQGVHSGAKFGVKSLEYATPIAGLVNPELGALGAVGGVGLKSIERASK